MQAYHYRKWILSLREIKPGSKILQANRGRLGVILDLCSNIGPEWT